MLAQNEWRLHGNAEDDNIPVRAYRAMVQDRNTPQYSTVQHSIAAAAAVTWLQTTLGFPRESLPKGACCARLLLRVFARAGRWDGWRWRWR
jgi:hypothetical protein